MLEKMHSFRIGIIASARRGREYGFTVLELMIATTVFAVILLVIAAGVISFTTSYYKGVTSTKTQATTRTVMAELSQAIQLSTSVKLGLTSGDGITRGICIDNTLYSYRIGQEIVDSSPGADQGYHALVKDTSSGACAAGPSASQWGSSTLPAPLRELLGKNMRLGVLDVQNPGGGDLYTIHIRIIYGDDDLLTSTTWPTAACKSGAGSQFCAVSDLTTSVVRRLQ